MQARRQLFRSVFGEGADVQFALPKFQRAYTWQKANWSTLWEDVLQAYESKEDNPEHFMGAIVVINEKIP